MALQDRTSVNEGLLCRGYDDSCGIWASCLLTLGAIVLVCVAENALWKYQCTRHAGLLIFSLCCLELLEQRHCTDKMYETCLLE